MSAEYVRNPDLVVFQRRLFAPTYMGPGKWVMYDTSTRRSHLAVRSEDDVRTKDIPRVMKYLIEERPDQLDRSVVNQLLQAGLMVRRETCARQGGAENFLLRFQQVVYDYPFVDYSSSDAFQFDRELMAEYADESEMPSVWTKRAGTSIPLPEISWSDVEPRWQGRGFDLKSLASILRFSFGQIGSFRVPGGERVRKANPSGGAKHPTEAWLELGQAWCGLQPATYAYDAENHALVKMEKYRPASGRTGLTLSIRSRLERAMWRYRDPRSSGAVLFDAGHVIENILILIRFHGADAALVPGRFLCNFSSDDFREPELGRIDISLHGDPPRELDPQHGGDDLNGAERGMGEPLVANPLAYFTLKNGGFTGNLVYPDNRRINISPGEFSILTHCIPSSRGAPSRPRDRYAALKDIIDAVPGSSEADVERLENNELLLTQTRAKVVWPEVRRWAEKGWYLPLLAWAEASTAPRDVIRAEPESDNERSMSGFSNIGTPLQKRVTTRSFHDRQITSEQLRTIIADAVNADSDISESALFVASFKVSGLAPETMHQWDFASNDFIRTERSVTADDVVRVTIGQGWVRNCAAMIWLLSSIDTDCPRNYAAPHILLGRIAQRLALRSTTEGLGVFQTPATLDRDLANILGHEATPEALSYSVAIGSTSRKETA